MSPINGNIDGLGNILMMSGTSEIMYPDCERLMKKAEKAHVNMKFSIYKGMPHTWILLFFKESKAAFKEISEFLNQLIGVNTNIGKEV